MNDAVCPERSALEVADVIRSHGAAFLEKHGSRAGSTTLYAVYQALTDRHLLAELLRHTGGNLSQASRTLGITRATLRTKLNSLRIAVDRGPVTESGPR